MRNDIVPGHKAWRRACEGKSRVGPAQAQQRGAAHAELG